MGRFLIRFSYFGTRYSGVQIQPKVDSGGKAIVTVQGALENALKYLFPANDFKVSLSSRTDKGVHSLRNACHVDLQHPEYGEEYIPEVITNVMNYRLKRDRHDVRVLETRRVSDNFHVRFHAIERRYIYRIAHTPKENISESEDELLYSELAKYSHGHSKKYPSRPYGESLVITDAFHIRAFRQTLNIEKLIKAAEMLSGIHDYTSFTGRKSQKTFVPDPIKLLTIGVKRGQPMGQHLYGSTQYLRRDLEYWDVHVRARSFLFRQVRRMVGGMVLVAKGVITLDELRDLLENPRVDFPSSSLMGMDEYGLFLADVVHKPEALEFDASSEQNKKSFSSQTPGEFCGRDRGSEDSSSSDVESCGDNHRTSGNSPQECVASDGQRHQSDHSESLRRVPNPSLEPMSSSPDANCKTKNLSCKS